MAATTAALPLASAAEPAPPERFILYFEAGTADLVPMCHSLSLSHVGVSFRVKRDRVEIECTAETSAQTGVEMEALTAVQVGLLTVYDMCKAVDRGMHIENVRLLEKSGGKSGHWVAG